MLHNDNTLTARIYDCHLVARAATAWECRQFGALAPVIAVRAEGGRARQLLEVVALTDRLSAADVDALTTAIAGPPFLDEAGARWDEDWAAVREVVTHIVQQFADYFLPQLA